LWTLPHAQARYPGTGSSFHRAHTLRGETLCPAGMAHGPSRACGCCGDSVTATAWIEQSADVTFGLVTKWQRYSSIIRFGRMADITELTAGLIGRE
jgi:hypothetical protein